MSSVECLREFVNERLTAAAEEIFGIFEKTIVEYEEEIDRQRRLLDSFWKPEIKLHRIELPQQHVSTEEEVLADQQLCIQERNSSLDQEDPEPPQIKEEQEELCTSQEGEQLVLKQETDAFMLTPTYEESDHNEDQTLYLNDDLTQNAAEKEPIVNISVKSSVVPEPNSDQQLLSHNCHKAESQDHKGSKHEDSGSTRDAEPELQKRQHKRKSNSNNVCKIHLNTCKKSFKCDTCGKDFKDKSKLDRHLRIHTGEKPYFCNTCGNRFSDLSILRRHITIHTGERPYSCKTCGKNFRLKSDLKVHLRTHTGEKPYNCNTCGKRYCRMPDLKKHVRIHTSEKQCTCKTQESSVET
ncbi:zinc finger and SCAN domain-containing protein 31-like [Siniperca chuatsi]|uniref:zinc finger and SCAN domain-containing protein 31-like n=1 Tax=Siniperca chuatsi TaxID=119488 RepID=UPI001CE21097|nr:zinc finger and SCAN domain-containing protein 31-like [Siniperca chuatsi]